MMSNLMEIHVNDVVRYLHFEVIELKELFEKCGYAGIVKEQDAEAQRLYAVAEAGLRMAESNARRLWEHLDGLIGAPKTADEEDSAGS